MRLHSMCTPSIGELRDKWFLPTLIDDFEVDIQEIETPDEAHEYGTLGWHKLMLAKVDCILSSINRNWAEAFIYSDIDIQFFDEIAEPILKSLSGYDMVFQRDDPDGTICAGFFACIANSRVQEFWLAVREQLTQRFDVYDQEVVNEILLGGGNTFGVSWNYLPTEFMGGGTFSGRHWSPGEPLDLPPRLLMHHANFTTGLANKIAQMEHVRDSYDAHILPRWTPIAGILPKEGPLAEVGIPFTFNWCCGPIAKLQLTCYRAGAHLLVIDCQNIQFDEMMLGVNLAEISGLLFQVGRKSGEDTDLLQAIVNLQPGVQEISLHFDQWRQPDTEDPRPLALILRDICLWECAEYETAQTEHIRTIMPTKPVRTIYDAHVLPKWVPIAGILPKEGPLSKGNMPFRFNWCCGPVAKLQLTCYRAGAHRLVIECQNIQFDELKLAVSLPGNTILSYQLGNKSGKDTDLLQAVVNLQPGPQEVSLHFDQWRKADAKDPRPLALILLDIRLWECAEAIDTARP